jgi:predicted nucleotidyltransferase
MVSQTIIRKIEEFISILRGVEKIHVDKVILFGSRSKGKTHKDSDIDIAIVSRDFGKDRYKEGSKLFEIAAKVDPRIEPVPISSQSWEKDNWVPLFYEIKKTGVEIRTLVTENRVKRQNIVRDR